MNDPSPNNRRRVSRIQGPLLAVTALSLITGLQPASAGTHRSREKEHAMPASTASVPAVSGLLDTLRFGDMGSETAHHLSAQFSDTISGGLGEPARRLLPKNPVSWDGGTAAFRLKVDPDKPNYVTIRLWGSDISENRLILFCEGKQIGWHHLGEVDNLDFGSEGNAPGFNDRFFYNTSPLPIGLTRGKSELNCEVRCIGRIWGYGSNFDQYQKPMTTPTRGLYSIYTHTDSFFVPPDGEKQGTAPATPPTRTGPGPEVLDTLKKRVNNEIDGLLRRDRILNQMQIQFLAKAYYVRWSHAYQNRQVVESVIRGIDGVFTAYRNNPKLAEADPATYNPDWFGLGPSGDAIRMLADEIRPVLDENLQDGNGGVLSRRAAWSEMLQASRDWHQRHRREYTNQSMIVDMYTYLANRGIAAIDPPHALPDTQLRRYLYESIGILPWLGSETDHGPEKPLGDHYFQLTSRGLTRELGFVGYYGEVLDWIAQIYDATADPGKPGDPKIKAQLVKLAHARSVFRYPALDADGNRAMRIEAIVGWRDAHYPGDIVYAERPSWDGSATYAPALTMDPAMVGWTQQMFADNQFYNSVEQSMRDGGLRVTAGLMGIPDQFAALHSQPANSHRLPMSPSQPDFVWADEEDGVVAIKHGADILYASLYWRARHGINSLARVHYITPTIDRIAVVRQEEQFEPSGMTYTRPNWTDMGFGNGGYRYPGGLNSAHAGETLPIAKIPDGIKFKPGDENSYAGRAQFYACRYGDYLIGMNCTADKSFKLSLPAGVTKATDLGSRNHLNLVRGEIAVGPRSTMVLYLGSGDAGNTAHR